MRKLKPFHFYEDAAGEHRWRFVAANGQIMATSGEGYRTRAGAHRAAKRLLAIIVQQASF